MSGSGNFEGQKIVPVFNKPQEAASAYRAALWNRLYLLYFSHCLCLVFSIVFRIYRFTGSLATLGILESGVFHLGKTYKEMDVYTSGSCLAVVYVVGVYRTGGGEVDYT